MIRTKILCFWISNSLKKRCGIKLSPRFSFLHLTFHRSYRIFPLLVLVSLIFTSTIKSQQAELQFEDISFGEGISTSVQNIFQDRIGYLWFATWSGLYKFDGYNFTLYKHYTADTTSIFNNTLNVVYEDKSGILWIGSRLGLERFDPVTETFTHFTLNPWDTGDNESNQIWSICEDKYGMLWIGTDNGLFTLNRETEKFTCFRNKGMSLGSISDNSINAIYEDKLGFLWFGTNRGLDKLDRESNQFLHHWLNSDATTEWNKYWVNKIFEDKSGVLWIGTRKGIMAYNKNRDSLITYPRLKDYSITSISEDLSGNIWLSTWEKGIFYLEKESKEFKSYLNYGIKPYDTTSNPVISLCCEKSGTFWIGTITGVKKLNQTIQPFKKYPMNDIACAIANGTEGVLWVFGYNKWFKKFDIGKAQFVPYTIEKGSMYYVWNAGADISTRSPEGGLYIQDTLGNVKFFLDSSWKLYIDELSFGWKTDKGYYAGSWSGDFDFWDPKANQVLKIKNLKEPIFWIYEDSYGLIWIATYLGKLICYNPQDGLFREFVSEFNAPSNMSGRRVNQIYEDSKRRLWFATNEGLSKLERHMNYLSIEKSNFIHFTTKDGLPSDNVRGILEDNHGYLWLNTGKGISRFDPEENKFKNYDITYGIEPVADVYYGCGCKTKDGEMYFPSVKGIIRFHPDSIKDNPFIPPIVITSFKKFDKSFRIEKEIRLPHDENFLSFEFAALSYVSNERNQYAYMMEGLDNGWVYSGTRRYASYPNLDPGEYVFKVKGSNNDGIWNEAGTSISVIISPPWWKATWAYILYSLLILSAVYTTWRLQLKRIRMSHEYEMSKFEAQKLHEVDEIKTRFFTNISHEFRTPLTLILGPVKQIIERTKEDKTRDDLKVVHKNANRLLGLVNQLLDISKLESGKMKLQTMPRNIVTLMKALTLSFTSYAERKRIALKFNSTEDEIIAYIDKDKIEKIITNVLSNAFKFTPEGGRIEVTLKPSSFPPLAKGELKGGSVEIAIQDTGVGIPKDKLSKIFDRFYQVDGSHTREQEGTGIGLSLTKELVELHKGTIEVESEAGKGTIVTISLPLGKEHLNPEEIIGQYKDEDYDKDKEYDKEKDYEKDQEQRKIHYLLTDEPRDYDDEVTKIRQLLDDDSQITTKQKIDFEIFEKDNLPLLLLVEDNGDVRNYIRSNLNKEFRILEAIDGEDGWDNTLEHIPDLVVSDVMMPKMDGFELCKKLKTDERTSHIPVILLTAKAASSDKIEGYEIGADDYIMKPFEPYELKARIKNLIEQRKRLHEHFKKHGLYEIEGKNISSLDQKILQNAVRFINEHISDTSLNIEMLSENLALSRSVLHRKICSLLGEAPGELIKIMRLKKAANLIENNFGNLSEIALEVGFSNPAYFSECFKKQFGIPPSQYHLKFTTR